MASILELSIKHEVKSAAEGKGDLGSRGMDEDMENPFNNGFREWKRNF